MSNPQTTATAPEPEHGPKAATPEVKTLLAERTAKIAAVTAEQLVGADLRGKGDKKGAASSDGRLANRVAEVGRIEDTLAELGYEVEPYVYKKTNGSRNGKTTKSAAEIQTSLDGCWAAHQSASFETTKTRMAKRIEALLRTAAERNLQVKDPRKAQLAAA